MNTPPDNTAPITAIQALLATDLPSDRPPTAAEIEALLVTLDQSDERAQIGELITALLPVETLVPEVYAAWRPVVRDVVAYVATHLSPPRLAPKLQAQLSLPVDTPLVKRVAAIINEMPSLQKLGQTLARYPDLDPELRRELVLLENSIQDVTPQAVQAVIAEELGARMQRHRVFVRSEILAEATVSAVVRFSWLDSATNRRRAGVFKVLKPHITRYFAEDLELLSGLAGYFDANRALYALPDVDLKRTFDDLRQLLLREIDFANEQRNLARAAAQYGDVSGVRIPLVVPTLSTERVSAMSYEDGVKITSAFPDAPTQRAAIARRVIEMLVPYPLLLPAESVLLHVDPHAGNLFVDETNGDLLLLDWALARAVSLEERRQMVLFLLGVLLRDPETISRAVAFFSMDDLAAEPESSAHIRGVIDDFLAALSPWKVASLRDARRLLAQLLLTNVRFSPLYIFFEKMLFTLDTVVESVAPEVDLGHTALEYVLVRCTGALAALSMGRKPPADFNFPLEPEDWMRLAQRAREFYWRLGQQKKSP